MTPQTYWHVSGLYEFVELCRTDSFIVAVECNEQGEPLPGYVPRVFRDLTEVRLTGSLATLK